MKVLVTYGTKNGGTRGIAEHIAHALLEQGHDAEAVDAATNPAPDGYDAVVVGAGLYAFRWEKHARRWVKRHAGALAEKPVWMFSSGPLDDSAAKSAIPPVRQVQELMHLVGARGHATFGGRLEEHPKGFVARQMAKTHTGDWRDWGQIRRFALDVVAAGLSTKRVEPVPHTAATAAPPAE